MAASSVTTGVRWVQVPPFKNLVLLPTEFFFSGAHVAQLTLYQLANYSFIAKSWKRKMLI